MRTKMDALGGYQELVPAARGVSVGAFLGLLFLTALLERLQFELRDADASAWWSSNGRDVLNGFALALVAWGMKIIGFTGPIALAVAATLVITLSALQASLARYPRLSTLLSIAVALGLGAPVLVAPHRVDAAFRRLIEWLA